MCEQILYNLFISQAHVPEDDCWTFPKPGQLTRYLYEYTEGVNYGVEKS
jgi:hypothetical protein